MLIDLRRWFPTLSLRLRVSTRSYITNKFQNIFKLFYYVSFRRNKVRTTIKLIVSIILLYFVFSKVGFQEIFNTLSTTNLVWTLNAVVPNIHLSIFIFLGSLTLPVHINILSIIFMPVIRFQLNFKTSILESTRTGVV